MARTKCMYLYFFEAKLLNSLIFNSNETAGPICTASPDPTHSKDDGEPKASETPDLERRKWLG